LVLAAGKGIRGGGGGGASSKISRFGIYVLGFFLIRKGKKREKEWGGEEKKTEEGMERGLSFEWGKKGIELI